MPNNRHFALVHGGQGCYSTIMANQSLERGEPPELNNAKLRAPRGDGEPYGAPVATLEELGALDDAEIVEGYLDGRSNEPRPSGNRSKSYWHGWRNGVVDGGHMAKDAAMAGLARVYLARKRSRHLAQGTPA